MFRIALAALMGLILLVLGLIPFTFAFSQTIEEEKNVWMDRHFAHFKNASIFEQRVSMGEVVGSGIIRIGVVSLFVELDKTTPKIERFLAIEVENSGKSSSTYLTNSEARKLLNCVIRIVDVVKNPPVKSSSPVSYWANPKENVSIGVAQSVYDRRMIPVVQVGREPSVSCFLELKQLESLYSTIANSFNFLQLQQENDTKQ